MSGVEDRKRDLDPETSPDADRPEEPTVSELREPSTEKEVDEEPKAPAIAREAEPEPSHRAQGIGVIAPEQRDSDEAPNLNGRVIGQNVWMGC